MTTLLVIQNSLGHYISFRTFLVLVYDILGDFFWSSFMAILVVIQNNLGHCISFRTFWSSFMTTLVVIQNNLGHCISFRTFLVLIYDILGDFWSSFMTTLVVIQNNLGHCISFRIVTLPRLGAIARLVHRDELCFGGHLSQ